MNAFTAVAASMLQNGDAPEHVRSTLGLSDEEMASVSRHVPPTSSRPVPQPGPARVVDAREVTTDKTPIPTSPASAGRAAPPSDGSVPVIPVKGEVASLLAWAQKHPAAAVRAKGKRIRADLAELTGRRATDAAQREAEQRVADLKAQLEQAQADLRTMKAGGRPTPPATNTPTRTGAPAAAGSPAPAVPAVAGVDRRGPRKWGEIRRWARQNGHQVADQGVVRQAVLDAYDAAHATVKAAG
ncbi:Lsr2 family DNA-binding protein [Streptomyces sp. DT73]|uniref:Lsr2 family DNA-binding protein n=1 Tax=Streptomyces sp. DT73 TaxID=3393420 RepID=UPI003CF0A3E4